MKPILIIKFVSLLINKVIYSQPENDNDMIKQLLSLVMLLFVTGFVQAQTVILDFEGSSTATTFQYFGSTLDGTLTQIVPNPNPEGENTSSLVSNFIKPAVAEVWAGAFSSPNPTTPVDLTTNSTVA